MPSWAPPTAEDIQQVALLAARPEVRAYFFDRLENPNWVDALHEADFFTRQIQFLPEMAMSDFRRGQSRYLARAVTVLAPAPSRQF